MTTIAPESVNPIAVLDYDENGEGPWSAPGWAAANGRAWQAGWQGCRSGLVKRQWAGLPRDWVTAPGQDLHWQMEQLSRRGRHQTCSTPSDQ